MPILSSLGALTYTKVFLGDQWYWYIETTPGNATQFSSFDLNQENIYINGTVSSSPNVSVTNPQIVRVNNGNFTLPTDSYHAFYASGGNNSGLGNSISCDVTTGNVYMTGGQSNVGTGTRVSVTRLLNANGLLQDTFVDNATLSTRSRQPVAVETHANGTYTIAGISQESNSTGVCYVTNFTGNVKNYAKVIGNNAGSLVNYRTAPTGEPVVSSNDTIAVLSSNGNSIIRQYNTGDGVIDFDIDSSNNIYFNHTTATTTTIVKLDSTGNIAWQKQLSANVLSNSAIQIYSIDVAVGNVFVAGQANAPGGNISNGLPLAIMSFDSNTGNINWQHRFYESGINFLVGDPTIKYNDGNLYVSGTQSTGTDYGFMIKVPASGSIPGTGTYSGNLVYDNSAVTISNANITLTTGNLTIANAVSTAVVTSNITANTSNVWTFNSTRLV